MTTQKSRGMVEGPPPPQQGTPGIALGVQDHSFHTQAVFEINKQVARLEMGLTGVDTRLSKVEDKLDQVQIDLASLKTTAQHMESLLKTSIKALWTIAGSICVFLLGLLTLWLKHKMNL